MKDGFVIGKFYPFHMGHMYLLDVASSKCDRLTVWVCDQSGQKPNADICAEWIRQLYSKVVVVTYDDAGLSDTDSEGWAYYVKKRLGWTPDVVFTSEDYGYDFCRYLGCRHYPVDPQRKHVPISGTAIRSNPYQNWQFLAPPVRAYYAKRIVCVGAESTGTTTLATQLAEHYQTVWVPEYGRDYWVNKMQNDDQKWESNEFVHIAMEQTRREEEMARRANRILVCDTDAFATGIWHKRYLGTWNPQVEKVAKSRSADLYLLTGIEIPFVQDGTRDGEHIRRRMHETFFLELAEQDVPYAIVQGSREERLDQAVKLIEPMLNA